MKPQLTPKEAEMAIQFLTSGTVPAARTIAHATILTKLMAIRDGRELPDNVTELEVPPIRSASASGTCCAVSCPGRRTSAGWVRITNWPSSRPAKNRMVRSSQSNMLSKATSCPYSRE